RREPLLDPTGLREWVKRRTNDVLSLLRKPGDSGELGLPERKLRAVSIDEEAEYALMHGYAAYRYGFMADVVTSWSLMERVFDKEREAHGYSLILEDMRLKFPDKPATVHLSRLRACSLPDGAVTGRGHHCPLLDDARDLSSWRFLITTGQIGSDR